MLYLKSVYIALWLFSPKLYLLIMVCNVQISSSFINYSAISIISSSCVVSKALDINIPITFVSITILLLSFGH